MHLGCTGNLLLLDYFLWCHLATKSWIKLFWEALSVYPGNLVLKYKNILIQRTHDRSLMDVAFSAGLHGQNLTSFNQCYCKHKLLLLSDVSTVSKDRIEAWLLQDNFSLTLRLEFPGQSIIMKPTPGPLLMEPSQTMQTIRGLLHSWGGD